MKRWPEMTLAGGPVQATERTLRDMARPILYHYDPAFLELFDRASSLLKTVYRTKYDVVILQGEAILGLEAAAASLLSPAHPRGGGPGGRAARRPHPHPRNGGGEGPAAAPPPLLVPPPPPPGPP